WTAPQPTPAPPAAGCTSTSPARTSTTATCPGTTSTSGPRAATSLPRHPDRRQALPGHQDLRRPGRAELAGGHPHPRPGSPAPPATASLQQQPRFNRQPQQPVQSFVWTQPLTSPVVAISSDPDPPLCAAVSV